MIEGIPRISVLIICYNQEQVISRAIESLLAQKDYVYEICVSDDCSSDGTWNILQDYDKKNPGLFKLNRNNPNVGIFENIEKTWEMPTGDIVYRLAGDDECGDGWFKTVVEYIQRNNVDYKGELFCIYGDFKCIYPNGDAFIKRNRAITSGINPVSLYIRELIYNRSACFSSKILKKYIKVSQGRSHVAEYAQEVQLQLFTKKNYYISYVGNVYYTRVGVNVHFNRKTLNEREYVDGYTWDFLEQHGYVYTQEDKNHIKYKNVVSKKHRINSILYYLIILYYFFVGNNVFWGKDRLDLRRYFFALIRRLPHRSPIMWVID